MYQEALYVCILPRPPPPGKQIQRFGASRRRFPRGWTPLGQSWENHALRLNYGLARRACTVRSLLHRGVIFKLLQVVRCGHDNPYRVSRRSFSSAKGSTVPGAEQ